MAGIGMHACTPADQQRSTVVEAEPRDRSASPRERAANGAVRRGRETKGEVERLSLEFGRSGSSSLSGSSGYSMPKMLKKRSHKGYEKVATDDLDDIAHHYGPEDVPVPKVLHDFDPNVRICSYRGTCAALETLAELRPHTNCTGHSNVYHRWPSGCAVAT